MPLYKHYFWIARRINDESIMIRGNVDIAKFSLPLNADLHYVEELLDFFQNAPIALHWLSGTGHILWANRAELESLGYTKEEYIGHHIMEFCPDEELALNKVFADLSSGKTIRDAPFKFRTKSGELRYLIVDSNVNWNADGTFKHTRCFIRDDTQRKIEEEIKAMELKHMKNLNDGKDTFIRRIFHDIKTPLHIISHSVSDMEDSFRQKIIPKIDDFKFIHQNIDSIVSIAEDIRYCIEFSEGRTVTINPEPFEIETALRDIASYVETIERRSSQKLVFMYKFENCPKTVLSDSTIYRVFYHLFRNAVRFNSQDSNIHVEISLLTENDGSSTSRSSQDIYSFSITNSTNQLVDLSYINRSFHNSFTCMNSTTHASNDDDSKSLTSMKGLGLGLYVSYNLIQAMGGMLECTTSTTDEKHSVCFQFKLKLQSVEDARILPAIGRLSRSVSILNKTVKTWTSMSETEVAKAHIIDDDKDDKSSVSSTSSKSPVPYTLNSASSKSLLSNPQTMTFGSNTQPLPPIITNKDKSITSPVTISRRTITSCTNNSKSLSRILVVDDSPMCQRVLIRMLQKHGYEFDTADNGVEAIEKLSIEPCLYNACIMDLRYVI